MPIGFVGPALQGANFISKFGIPLLQQAGITAGLAGLGALANTTSRAPSSAPRIDRRPNVHRDRGPLNAIDYGKYGPTDWNPSANPSRVSSAPGPARGPADRAYQSAKAETAAMVATDPLMQQWSAAQKTKDFTTADQLGEQIWQNKYGGGRMGQPGGAIGSRNPLMDSTFGYQTGMSPGDIAKTITNPSAIPVSPGEAPYQIGDLGTRATSETGYDPTAYGITPEMIEEMKKRLLQQSAK
jgi:hypothetical protein